MGSKKRGVVVSAATRRLDRITQRVVTAMEEAEKAVADLEKGLGAKAFPHSMGLLGAKMKLCAAGRTLDEAYSVLTQAVGRNRHGRE